MPHTPETSTCSIQEISRSDEISIWVRRNRGVCSRVARELDVSAEFVRVILYGLGPRSTGLRVERALVAVGAPFVAARLESQSCTE